jgi:hypothetical protein
MKHPTPQLDRDARNRLCDQIRSFLDGRLMAFAFNDAISRIHDETDDPTVHWTAQELWHFYDDCDDHSVALSKPEWDYLQRLLLVLQSGSQVVVQNAGWRWSYTQLAAFCALLGFGCCVCALGVGEQLFVVTIPFGIISMMISHWQSKLRLTQNRQIASIMPFSSLTQLRQTFLGIPQFQKLRYRPELKDARIREPSSQFVAFLPRYVGWLLFSPIPLLFQLLPSKETRTSVQGIAEENRRRLVS